MANILAIDDNKKILKIIEKAAEIQKHHIITLDCVIDIPLDFFCDFDLILLDIMMPNISGFQVCKNIRNIVNCPIVFLTAVSNESSIVQGLSIGGDDYIKKPFGIMELNARINSHLRREIRRKQSNRLVLENIIFDFDKRKVYVGDVNIELTKTQYNICELLVLHRGQVFTKQQIYEDIYPIDSNALITTITEYIRIIRKKFKEVGLCPIETVWGVGYLWK